MPMTTDEKIDLFIKIFAQEFSREFNFLADVAAGRATRKADFTDKLIGILNKFVSGIARGIPAMGPITEVLGELGAVGAKLSEALKMVDGSHTLPKLSAGLGATSLWSIWHEHQQAVQIGHIAKQADLLDLKALAILLGSAAREIAYRYEFFMATRLSDEVEAVIAFAKCGVTRSLEYLARTGENITQETLLKGVMEGRSGRFIQGWFNTRLPGKEAHSKAALTGEGAYGRIAFCTGVNTFWVRHTPRHREVCLQLLREYKVEAALKKLREALSNYGYVKYRDKGRRDYPKYGYASVFPTTIRQYDYAPHEQHSHEVLREFEAHPWSRVTLSTHELVLYLQQLRGASPVYRLVDYIATQTQYRGAKTVVFHGDLSEFDLQGGDYSGVDFSGVTLSGDLSNTSFKGAFLAGAVFRNITQAQNADFSGAHCEYLKIEGEANLSASCWTQAHCQFADFTGADLTACEMTGVHWYKAHLNAVRGSDQLLIEQQQQLLMIEKENTAQKAILEKLQDEMLEQRQTMRILGERLHPVLHQMQTQVEAAKAQDTQIKALQAQVATLLQAQENRLTFEQYCRHQIKELQAQSHASPDRELTKMKAAVLRLQEMLANLPPIPTDLHAEVEALQREYPRLAGLCATLQTNLTALHETFQRSLSLHQQRIDTLSGELNQLREALTARIEKLEQRVDVVDQRVYALEQYKQLIEARLRLHEPSAEALYAQAVAAHKAQKLEEAYTLYERAAEKGYSKALTSLGVFALEGFGGRPADKALGRNLLERAAAQGHGRACYNLARMHEKGDDTPRDDEKALRLYRRALSIEPDNKDYAQKVTLLSQRIEGSKALGGYPYLSPS